MGYGDWIMATADAKRVNEKFGVRVQFGDGKKAYWDVVFENNPRIAQTLEPGETFAWIPNFTGCRPYIRSIGSKRYEFNHDFRASPGELYLPVKEKSDYILVEPNIKDKFWIGRNKDWGFNNWQKLVDKLDHNFLQIGERDRKKLKDVRFEKTDTFKEAIYWLSGAKLLITTDGALHHAAAALGNSDIAWPKPYYAGRDQLVRLAQRGEALTMKV